MKYKDLFIDFDDTLYDTHGNSVIALQETYEAFGLARYFTNPQVFYDAYWQTNIDLWTQYSKGEKMWHWCCQVVAPGDWHISVPSRNWKQKAIISALLPVVRWAPSLVVSMPLVS